MEALAKLQRPEEALAVLRARGAPAGASAGPVAGAEGRFSGSCAEAETALQIRLDCGLVTEAFLEVLPSRACLLVFRSPGCVQQQGGLRNVTQAILGMRMCWN